jgi:hypothetical protein
MSESTLRRRRRGDDDQIVPYADAGDGGEQSIAALGFHCRLCARRMKDALHGLKAWRGPGKGDRDRWVARVIESWVVNLRRCLACRIEADFQCLGFDNHARDMALDQLAVR